MPEPLTLIVGGFLGGQVSQVLSDVLPEVIGGRVNQHLVGAFLDRKVNHDVQNALLEAWKRTCNQIFDAYRDSPPYRRLGEDRRNLVDTRAALFVEPTTIAELFPDLPPDAPGRLLTADDVTGLFTADREAVNRELVAGLYRLGLWEDLPGGLQTLLRQLLLDGLTFHFVEIAVKRDPKARDALFFEQFVALRRVAIKTEEEQARLWAKAHDQLEDLEGYQRWQRKQVAKVVRTTKRTEKAVKGVAYQVIQVGVGVQTILAQMEEIVSYVRGGRLPRFTVTGNQLMTGSRSAPVMLRERQANHLERHRPFAGREAELARIRDFLSTRRRGYVLVTGPSGVGKTALLANLIAPKREQYAWYFLDRRDDAHRRLAFLRQMCEQLLAYYQLPIRDEADLPDQIDRLEALYSKLLRLPLIRAEKPMVVVIDGVDDAEDRFFSDVHIPRDLPEGKFIVFSVRGSGQDYPQELGLPEDEVLRVVLGDYRPAETVVIYTRGPHDGLGLSRWGSLSWTTDRAEAKGRWEEFWTAVIPDHETRTRMGADDYRTKYFELKGFDPNKSDEYKRGRSYSGGGDGLFGVFSSNHRLNLKNFTLYSEINRHVFDRFDDDGVAYKEITKNEFSQYKPKFPLERSF